MKHQKKNLRKGRLTKTKTYGLAMTENSNQFRKQVENDYNQIAQLCKTIIERDYNQCGLEEDIRKRILDLTLLWKRCKRKSEKDVGGLKTLFYDLLRAVNHANSMEKRTGKPKCYYVGRGLELTPPTPGALGNYFIRMALPVWWEDFSPFSRENWRSK